MIARFGIGVTLGAVVTFVLFLLMQALIKSDKSPFTDAPTGRIVDFVRLEDDPDLRRKKRKPEPPPPPDEPSSVSPPETAGLHPTTSTAATNGGRHTAIPQRGRRDAAQRRGRVAPRACRTATVGPIGRTRSFRRRATSR